MRSFTVVLSRFETLFRPFAVVFGRVRGQLRSFAVVPSDGPLLNRADFNKVYGPVLISLFSKSRSETRTLSQTPGYLHRRKTRYHRGNTLKSRIGPSQDACLLSDANNEGHILVHEQ